MDDGWSVLCLALLPGGGNALGGLLAESWRAGARKLNWALHAAAGAMVAIVAVELLPRASSALGGTRIALSFLSGGIGYMLLSGVMRIAKSDGTEGRRRMWRIYLATVADLASDGLMIGVGSVVSLRLALILAASQVLADLPAGYATLANFRDKGLSRALRLALCASFVLYPAGVALAARALLREASQGVQLSALVFVAGILTVAAVEDLLEEAHATQKDTQASVFAFVLGFSLFIFVSDGLSGWLGQDPEGGAQRQSTHRYREVGQYTQNTFHLQVLTFDHTLVVCAVGRNGGSQGVSCAF